jgi:hypothetical protein
MGNDFLYHENSDHIRRKSMTWRFSLLLLAALYGCFPTYSAPTVIPVSELIPPATNGVIAGELLFTVVIDRFRDERSSRSILGQYDRGGKGGFFGTTTVVPDRDITEVFEDIVKKSLARRGILEGPSPFILKGSIKQVNVGAAPDSQVLRAETFLQLTLINSSAGARLWQKSFVGAATGVDPKTTLALSFQDLAGAVDRDDTVLALRRPFFAAGGKLPEGIALPAVTQAAEIQKSLKSDVDELPAKKARLNRDSYAIVIGIEHYRQQLPKANFAAHDAQTMTEYLTRVMGYPDENIVTLLNEHAAKSDLEKYFEKWLPNNVKPASTVFVYYSGHGAPNMASGDTYLVPYDGDPSFINETGYSLQRMYAALGKLSAKNVIVAIDSCFSGAGGRSVIAGGARPLVMNLKFAAVPKNILVLSASSNEQISMSYDENNHGLFTYFLLKGIKNHDVVQQDGSLDITALFEYVKPQVQTISRRKYNNEQTPQLIGAGAN